MLFKLQHTIFGTTGYFTDLSAPNWLTSCDTVVGSTMDNRWFWEQHVLTLNIGETTFTDFNSVTRLE